MAVGANCLRATRISAPGNLFPGAESIPPPATAAKCVTGAVATAGPNGYTCARAGRRRRAHADCDPSATPDHGGHDLSDSDLGATSADDLDDDLTAGDDDLDDDLELDDDDDLDTDDIDTEFFDDDDDDDDDDADEAVSVELVVDEELDEDLDDDLEDDELEDDDDDDLDDELDELLEEDEEVQPLDEEEGGGKKGAKPRRKVELISEDEFTCRSCFLVKKPSQLADREAMFCFDCV